MCPKSTSWLNFALFTGIWRTSKRGIQCLFWWHCLPVFILSEAYYHNSEVIQDIFQLIGYHDNQSGSAPPDALDAVAQYCHAFRAWEYWETVWDAREWWEDSTAVQARMDVESILSARGIHRKWPSICRQGNVSKHIVCSLIVACWRSVWCKWPKTNGLPGNWLDEIQSKCTRTTLFAHSLPQFFSLFHHIVCSVKIIRLYRSQSSIDLLLGRCHYCNNNVSFLNKNNNACFFFFQQLTWRNFHQTSLMIAAQISQ